MDYCFVLFSFVIFQFNRKEQNLIFENLHFAIYDVADGNVLNWEKFWWSFHPLSGGNKRDETPDRSELKYLFFS